MDPLSNAELGKLRRWRAAAGLIEEIARAHLRLGDAGPILAAARAASSPADLAARLGALAPPQPGEA